MNSWTGWGEMHRNAGIVTRLAGIVALLWGAAAGAANAQSDPWSGHWTATSTASIAITGNIALVGNVLAFGNGTAVEVRPIGIMLGRWTPLGGTTPGAIYELIPPSDPALLNGNTLCGMPEPVRYVVFTVDSPGSLGLTVFTSGEPPRGFGDGSCATYFYER